MVLAGLIVAAFPIYIQDLVQGSGPFLGLLFGVLLFITGLFALIRPDIHTSLGFMGVVFSLLSFFGVFGGFLVGMFLGILGGSLTYAWIPPNKSREGNE